jgi:hypothetical protein
VLPRILSFRLGKHSCVVRITRLCQILSEFDDAIIPYKFYELRAL